MVTWTKFPSPVLVLGPAYAGKSELAMQALAPDRPAVVIGTALSSERAFAARLAELKALRPGAWDSLDCGSDLAGAVEAAATRHPQVLIDSLSQWLATYLVGATDLGEAELAARVQTQVGELLRIMAAHPATRFVLVSAEAGSGPAPSRPLERLYRQLTGLTNQRLARAARTVVTVTAGIPAVLKEEIP